MRKFWSLSVLSLLIIVMAFPIASMAQDSSTIVYDQVVTGEITADSYEIPYQFDGQEGDVILVEMKSTSENPRLDSYLRLLGPNGDELWSDDDSGGNLNSLVGPFTLPETGTFTIIATRFQQAEGSSTGSFELVVKLAQITTLFLDETVTIALEDGNEFAFFNYTASADGVFDTRVGGVNGAGAINVTIIDENGSYLGGFFVASGSTLMTTPFYLDAGDQILFSVRREANYATVTPEQPTGMIQFDMTLFEVDATPVVFDDAFSGTLNDDNPVDYYSFEGAAGDLISLRGERINGDFEVTLIDAFGRQFNGMATAYSEGQIMLDPITLSTTGTHLIVVRRFSADGSSDILDVTSDYALTLSSTQTPLLVNGVESTGMINPDGDGVYEQAFRYEGTQGEVIRVTLRSIDATYVPGLDIQAAQIEETLSTEPGRGGGGGGNFYVGFNASEPGVMTYEFTLPKTTVYLFYVRGGYGQNGPLAGEFGLMLESID